jgi:hypothetical protein
LLQSSPAYDTWRHRITALRDVSAAPVPVARSLARGLMAAV